MSRSAGPGSPLTFRCNRCRSTTHLRDESSRGLDYVLTGLALPAPRSKYHARGVRNGSMCYQYRCNDCGHTGWSSHNDVATRFERRLKVGPRAEVA